MFCVSLLKVNSFCSSLASFPTFSKKMPAQGLGFLVLIANESFSSALGPLTLEDKTTLRVSAQGRERAKGPFCLPLSNWDLGHTG